MSPIYWSNILTSTLYSIFTEIQKGNANNTFVWLPNLRFVQKRFARDWPLINCRVVVLIEMTYTLSLPRFPGDIAAVAVTTRAGKPKLR